MVRTHLLIALLLPLAACGDGSTGPEPPDEAGPRGKVFANHDEWTLTDQGFDAAPDAAVFAANVVRWFTSETNARLLAWSSDFGLTGARLAQAMESAGHEWTVRDPDVVTSPDFSEYDAVFVGGNQIPSAALIDYVAGGGNVYVAGGVGVGVFSSAVEEAAAWNPFLETFGLRFAPAYNFVRATITVTSSHPTLVGVRSLYFDRGNSVSLVDPTDTGTRVLLLTGSEGLLAVSEP